jgi:hypothetical protein
VQHLEPLALPLELLPLPWPPLSWLPCVPEVCELPWESCAAADAIGDQAALGAPKAASMVSPARPTMSFLR